VRTHRTRNSPAAHAHPAARGANAAGADVPAAGRRWANRFPPDRRAHVHPGGREPVLAGGRAKGPLGTSGSASQAHPVPRRRTGRDGCAGRANAAGHDVARGCWLEPLVPRIRLRCALLREYRTDAARARFRQLRGRLAGGSRGGVGRPRAWGQGGRVARCRSASRAGRVADAADPVPRERPTRPFSRSQPPGTL